MKKLLTLLLTVVMITSSLSFVSLAEQGSETDGFIANYQGPGYR